MNSKNVKQTTGVFGIYRWILAGFVVNCHLDPANYGYLGAYAVLGFFALSGYLMFLTFSKNYSGKKNARSIFFLNRILRIYPAYLIALFFTVGALLLFPEISKKIHPLLTMPNNVELWYKNISALGLTSIFGIRAESIILPPAWSLSNEIIFYLCVPFLFANSYLYKSWVAWSVICCLIIILFSKSLFAWYFSILGTFIAFAFGTLIYQINQKSVWRNIFSSKAFFSVIIVLFIIFNLFTKDIFVFPLRHGMHISLVIHCLLILALSNLSINKSGILYKVDKFLGELSYPIFLVHVTVGALLLKFFNGFLEENTFKLFLVGFAVSNIVAILIYLLVDRQINKIRARIVSHAKSCIRHPA